MPIPVKPGRGNHALPAIVEKQAVRELVEQEAFTNSLTSLCETLGSSGIGFPYGGGAQLSQADTMFANNRWYLVSNFRQLLSQMYVEHGIVQTLVDQPVDDAFRAGFEIKSNQLDGDDIEKLEIYMKRNKVIHSLMQAIKWGRLFGGGALLIITDQNPVAALNIAAIGPDSPLEFRAVDMWELYYTRMNMTPGTGPESDMGINLGDDYNYYGFGIHKSRVYRVEGKQAPSFIRQRLRGWGMSELERLVRSLNQFLKNQDVIFELLDEAKVDVYKIKGFSASLFDAEGTKATAQRIQLANQLKNYNNALTMDAEDDYAQKQITFTGLAEVLLQIRQGIAADLKMPITKLFGISAAGFNSGEDDIENYNAMIEGEIRAKNEFMVVDVLNICCQKVFGFVPDDLQITFNPLRILNAKEEEEVKDSKFNRVMSAYSSGLMPDDLAKEAMNKDSLLPVELDPTAPTSPPLQAVTDEPAGAKGGTGKQTPQQA